MKHILLTTITFFLLVVLVKPSMAQKATQVNANHNRFVLIETTQGKLKVEIFTEVKQHADNFIKLVKEHFYDSLLFHRVMPNLIIQSGDPQSKHATKTTVLGSGQLSYTVPNEIKDKYYHRKGALVAAADNSAEKKASSACQFYIVDGKTYTDAQLDAMEKNRKHEFSDNARADYKDNGGTPQFDGSNTVFGQVVEGLDVIDKISSVSRNKNGRPIDDVRILRIKLIRN